MNNIKELELIELDDQVLLIENEDQIIQSLTQKELWMEVELDQINVNHKTGREVNKVIPKITEGRIKGIWKEK